MSKRRRQGEEEVEEVEEVEDEAGDEDEIEATCCCSLVF